MKNILLITLLTTFVTHFTAEVIITNDKVQNAMNNVSYVLLGAFFVLAIVGAMFFPLWNILVDIH